MPIMTASNALPPEPTSRVVTWRSLPSSRIVYFTLIPVFAVNSEGVSDAMSVICGFATIATLIVLALVPPIAVAASDASATTPARKTPRTVARRCVLPFGAFCMVDASSCADPMPEDNVVRKPLSRGRRWLYDQSRVDKQAGDYVVRKISWDSSASHDARRRGARRRRLED